MKPKSFLGVVYAIKYELLISKFEEDEFSMGKIDHHGVIVKKIHV